MTGIVNVAERVAARLRRRVGGLVGWIVDTFEQRARGE
jgi:hypothetical protein